jgi:hypothetical protein
MQIWLYDDLSRLRQVMSTGSLGTCLEYWDSTSGETTNTMSQRLRGRLCHATNQNQRWTITREC